MIWSDEQAGRAKYSREAERSIAGRQSEAAELLYMQCSAGRGMRTKEGRSFIFYFIFRGRKEGVGGSFGLHASSELS